MYIRYIHKLCDMHLQAENYTGERDIPWSLLELLMAFLPFLTLYNIWFILLERICVNQFWQLRREEAEAQLLSSS